MKPLSNGAELDRIFNRRVLTLVVLCIIYGSVYPGVFAWRAGNPLTYLLTSWPARIERVDTAENVLLYAPLGVVASLFCKRRMRSIIFAGCLGFLLSAALELTQYYIPERVASPVDLVSNTAGALAAAFAAWRFRPPIEALIRRVCLIPASGASLLMALWIAYQFYPLIPHFGPRSLPAEFYFWLHRDRVLPAEICADLAEWFAVGLVIESICGQMKLRWFAGLVALRVALRPFVLTRMFGLEELIGAAIAIALWMSLRKKARGPAGLTLLIASIALRYLTPLPFSDLAAAFGYAGVLFRVAFDFGAVIWLIGGGSPKNTCET